MKDPSPPVSAVENLADEVLELDTWGDWALCKSRGKLKREADFQPPEARSQSRLPGLIPPQPSRSVVRRGDAGMNPMVAASPFDLRIWGRTEERFPATLLSWFTG